MTTTTKPRKPLARGDRTHTTINNSVVVYVQRGEVQGFRVWVEQGMQVVEGWDFTFATGSQAVAEYDRAIAAFTAHGTWQGLERRLNELGRIVAEQEGRKARRMCDYPKLEAAEAEYATLVTFGTAKQLREIEARRQQIINRRYAA